MRRYIAGLVVILAMPLFMVAGALIALLASTKTLGDIFTE